MPKTADLTVWKNQLADVVTKVKLLSFGRTGTSYETTVGYRRFQENAPAYSEQVNQSDSQPDINFAPRKEYEDDNDGRSDSEHSILETDKLSNDAESHHSECKERKNSNDQHQKAGKPDSITEWQAGWNVTNAIQGMFIVSFPYAVLQGGYWAIISMIVVAQICCYTGKILVECLYEDDEEGKRVRVRNSYGEIAQAVFGSRIGSPIVNLAQVIELLMTCILYILLCGELLHGSFPSVKAIPLGAWIALSALPLLSCAFLKTMRRVSWLSLWCSIAHILINLIIIIYCLTLVNQWQPKAVRIDPDIWTFPISLGIVVFSYTSQIFLPTLEGKMVKREKFSCMMHWTHLAAAAFKAVFSYIGFITWGNGTNELITNNLPSGLKEVVNVILVVKALLSYPLPYYASVDIIEKAFFQDGGSSWFSSCHHKDGQSFKWWATALRLLLVVITMVMAIWIPHFAILMGLIGSFTGTMLSFVWPCIFHLYLKRRELKWWQKGVDIFIILLGVLCGLLGIYYSSRALIMAIYGLDPRPWKFRTDGASNFTSAIATFNFTSHILG